jgi:hypothetical protein
MLIVYTLPLMPDFLAASVYAYENASPGFVEMLVQSRREELFTGLMRLHYASSETCVLTFLDGVQQNLYRCLEKSTEVVPRRSWSVIMDLPNASVSFMPLTIESMRLMLVAHESPIVRVEEQTPGTKGLAAHVGEWSASREPSILYIRTNSDARIYLISGISNPIIEGITFANGSSSFSINDASFAAVLPPDVQAVIRYVGDREHVSWQEHELRLAFNPLMRLLLSRFSELAGRMLTERLCERISTGLKEEGWNIKVSMNGVSNRQYFESLENSINVYVGMIRSFHEEASPAIGQRMAEGLYQEVLPKLDPYWRELILRHVYNDNYVDTEQEGSGGRPL